MIEQWNALYQLFLCYLHMQAWGTPHYKDADPDDQEVFRGLVESKQLYGYVEDTKHTVLRSGLEVPDRWLAPIDAARICEGKALSDDARSELGWITTQILAHLPRLHPDAQPTRKLCHDKETGDTGDISGVLLDSADVEIMKIARNTDLGGEDRMLEILRIDRRFEAKKSTWWANLLQVSAPAVRQYDTWKSIQAGKRNPD